MKEATVLSEEAVVEDREARDADALEELLVEDELLVEEVASDGMCGVY